MKLFQKYLLHIIAIIAITLVLIALFNPPMALAVILDEIRLSWQNDPSTTITIMWRTEVNVVARVQYGNSSNYGLETTGTSGPAVLDNYYYHTVELTGLTPNTDYHYRVRGESNSWSGDFTFKTAPDGPKDFTFTVFADNGTDGNNGNRTLVIKDLIAGENPAFHLVPGDLTYADGDWCDGRRCAKEHWEQWFQEIERFSHSVPIMTSYGNHEDKSDVKFDSGETFYERSLALPNSSGSELYYSFDYGDIHFISLNSDDYRSLRPGKNQYEWLVADLSSSNKTFKVVFMHHPPFTSGEHAPVESIQHNIVPLFDQYNVDLVLSGHNHHYERTLPLLYNDNDYKNPRIASTETANYSNLDSTIYVITGGGGGGLYDFNDPKPDWSQVRYKGFQYLKVDVDDAGFLTISSINLEGEIVDQFTISKNGAQSPTPPPTEPTVSTESVPNLQTIRGFNFAVWWHDILNKDSTKESIDKMKDAGGNYFGLAPFWYQNDKHSTTIYRHDDKTATDASVRSAIQYAKSIGLKISLKPMVDSRDDTWRGALEPSDTNAWFESYKSFILNYARISQDADVEWLIIGTELNALTTPEFTIKWKEIIQEIRAVYSGNITYAGNWGNTDWGEYYHVGFWDDLDAIGIDAYFPLATKDEPSVSEVEQAWTFINALDRTQNWFSDINALHEIHDKPVILTEIGFLSCKEAGIQPWKYPCKKGVDLQEQANLYEGTLNFWKDVDWMLGYLWWRWDADPNDGGENSGDYVPQNKQPTLDVLARFWNDAPTINASPAPTANSSSASSSPSSSSSSGGGGSAVSPGSTLPSSSAIPVNTTPERRVEENSNRPIFAYGKPRLPSLSQERALAWDLALQLRTHYFNGPVPLRREFWPIYINAYVYGDYPVNAIARSIELGGKTVHTAIPWTAWRRSQDYQNYMR